MTEMLTPQGVEAPARSYDQFIGGEWTAAADHRTFEVLDPYTGEVYANVAAGGPDDASRAVAAAVAAGPIWKAVPPVRKQEIFLRAAEIVEQRRAELSEILARETGCTIFFANFQQTVVIGQLRQAAGWVYLPKGEILQSDVPGTYSTAIRRPLGVVASFTPWNGANVLGWRSIIAPLAAGNTVVVKPSEEAPISAGLVMAEIMAAAGCPSGVVNVVTHAPGEAAPIADVFFENPDVRCINFIGSVQTARFLAERAGRALKRSVMELGGYNPLIVLADVDLDYAVQVATFSAFFHQGQICLNARKIIVERSIYDEFLARFIKKANSLPLGDPRDAATVIGPLINDRALQTVRERIADAVGKGARVVAGGGHDGRVHEPTILVDVPAEATVSCEETFGPVVVVQPVDSAEEAVKVANAHSYGLSSAILTGDTYRGLELADQIEAGQVHINIPTVDDEVQAPIGGVRNSGWGRSGPHSLDDFSDLIWVNAQSGQRHLPL